MYDGMNEESSTAVDAWDWPSVGEIKKENEKMQAAGQPVPEVPLRPPVELPMEPPMEPDFIDKRPILNCLIGKKVRVVWMKIEGKEIVGTLELDVERRFLVFDEDNDPMNVTAGVRFGIENVLSVINGRFQPIITLTEQESVDYK